MKIHIAGCDNFNFMNYILEMIKQPFYWHLFSYLALKDMDDKHKLIYNELKNRSKGLLIDSGAFSFQRGNGGKIDWIKYTKQYANFIQDNDDDKIMGYFEMDIDNIVGYDNVLKLRNILEEVTDKIIPVWHRNRGIKDFKEMCKKYNYVAITGMSTDIKRSQFKNFVDYAHSQNARIHGLGITGKKIIDNVPFDSVDSTSWLSCSKYANINNRRLDSDYVRNNYMKVHTLSYIQWLKKQKEYYNKWYDICDWKRNDEIKII